MLDVGDGLIEPADGTGTAVSIAGGGGGGGGASPPKSKAAKLPSNPSVCRLFLISCFSSSGLSICGRILGAADVPSSTCLTKLRRRGE
jgi:hypothetical protein